MSEKHRLHYYALSFVDGASVSGGGLQTHASVYIGYPDQRVTMARIAEAKREAGVSQGAVLIGAGYLGRMTPSEMRRSEPEALHSGAQVAELERQIEGLEALRPVWAQGYGDASSAAQATAAALAQLWKSLGAADQTQAVQRLSELTEERDSAVAFIRSIGEEMVNAGMKSGDRSVIMANLRQLTFLTRKVMDLVTVAGYRSPTSELGPLATAALDRPRNYRDLTPREQWSIDEKLGILDWSGDLRE